MTSIDTAIDFPITSTRLRTLILKKHLSTLYSQLSQEKKADPNLTRMIRLNMFHIFQTNKINFMQYLKLHNHSDPFTQTCEVMTQTDYTTIRPRFSSRILSKRRRSPLEKDKLKSYWPSDDNDSTDYELQKDPPELMSDPNSPYKTYTYISFESQQSSHILIETAQ